MAIQRMRMTLMKEILETREGRLVDLQRSTRSPPGQPLRILSFMVDRGLLDRVQESQRSSTTYVITRKVELALSRMIQVVGMLDGAPFGGKTP